MTAAPLSQLNSDLRDLFKDIDYFSTPLKDVHDALDKLNRIEKTPKRIRDKVAEIHSVLTSLQTACKAAAWIPEVGEDAKAAAETLDVINRFLAEIETVLGDIQSAADDGAERFLNLKDGVDKSWTAIVRVEGFLERAENVTSDLLKRYAGHAVPASVDKCAERLDAPLRKVVDPLNDAKDEAQQKLNAAERAAEAMVTALSQAVAFSDFIDGVYVKLEPVRDAIAQVSNAVRDASRYGEKKIRLILAAGETLGGKEYRKVKRFIDQVEKEIEKLKRKFVDWAFKPIRDAMTSARDQLMAELKKLPDFGPATTAMATVQHLLAQVDAAIEGLASKCADLFSGKTLLKGDAFPRVS